MSADLRELVRATLGPYGLQAKWEGPSLLLNPYAAVSLVLVLHELATNAAKYGALSAPEGNVTVVWHVDPAARHRLTLHWEERGGPRVQPPSRRGFGSRLIAASLKGDLAGSATFDYAAEGLTCVMSIIAPPKGAA
jgi:two-component sensor histidine kinase